MSNLNAPVLPEVWMALLTSMTRPPETAPAQSAALKRHLEAFLQSVERRALCMLELGTRQREEALDLLQDCMLRFVDRYSDKPAADWPPLFFRVVSNALIDWQRRRSVRNKVIALWPWGKSSKRQDEAQPVEFDAPAAETERPDSIHARNDLMQTMNRALAALPTRQRQTFLLREWQGLSVAESALALGISQGSIKTHLSRAQARLREALHEHA